ncbi:MAG: exodeoxyribonuclease small subunit [Campylobacterota bacterium]|nr:exodeoxyribonuclease small subunit [Campylobacterota bacterium]
MSEKNIEKSFEDRLKNAKEILEKLNNSELPLDEGLKLYKDGMKELSLATKMLEDAKLEFETIESALADGKSN